MIDKPSWLYKSVNVENIEIIKKECSDIVTKHFPNIFGDRGFTFTYVDKDILRNEAPTYVQILKDFNLYESNDNPISNCYDKPTVNNPLKNVPCPTPNFLVSIFGLDSCNPI